MAVKSMSEWVEFAKDKKAIAVESMERGDLPPTVVVERDGELCAIVIASQIDKEKGIQAAVLCQTGFDPDALIMIMDAHVHTAQKVEGQTVEQAREEMAKKFPPGSMQKMCDEEGACETGLITDCLICHRIDRNGSIDLVTLPYSYHGKNGPPFVWLDQDPKYKEMTALKDDQITGYIPNSLREIMKQPSLFENEEFLKMSNAFEFTPERRRFHTARAIMSILKSQDFFVMDCISGRHPEWTGAVQTSLSILNNFIKEGMLPKEAYAECSQIIESHTGTEQFVTQMTALLSSNPDWLPQSIRDNIDDFVLTWEEIAMSPPRLSSDSDSDSKLEVGTPVVVWNGNRTELLGEGKYAGEATVYFIRMPDGSLRSSKNAEIEPEDIPEGATVVCSENNPKLILNDGQVVYGCQVWWEPIKK